MAEDNCIFCKIARGVIPSTTVYEDEDFRVILDLGPASKGHSLILPKKHFANVCELDAETAAKVLPLGAKIGAAMKKGLGCAGFNLVQNNGEAAGQTVMHFHMHVIPRHAGDDVQVTWKQGETESESLKALADAIKNAIKAKEANLKGQMASEGTTPRRLTDLIGSLCDLTSGSGDKGTPIVLVQNYFNNYAN